MSFINRITRAVDSFNEISNDEVTNFGMAGEQEARRFIEEEDGLTLHNPIIPHPRDKNKFLEMDSIIYNKGNVYCIEIKNYKGKITFIPAYEEFQEKVKFLFFFTRTITKKIQTGWDDSRISKEKEGNYGEGVFYEEYPNPMKKTKYFIKNLKNYLSNKNNMFGKVFIKPIVAFNRENADISSIHSFEKGYIYIDEIHALIEENSNGSNRNLQWIRNGLIGLSTWDTIITSSNEEIYGVIKDSYLDVCTLNNDKVKLNYKDIKSIKIERNGIFSKEDRLFIKFTDNTENEYKNIRGNIILNKFGNLQEHKISNINFVNVGTWRLRKDNVL